MPHEFDYEDEERNILVITTNSEIESELRTLGIDNIYGLDIMKLVKVSN